MIPHRPAPRRQQGAVLVTVLVLLLVMTLLGVVSIRTTLVEERMSADLYDRSLAFQAAEAGLRAGEAIAATRPTYTGGCASGTCGFPVASAAPVWESQSVWEAAPAATVNLDGMVASPKYIIELLADKVPPRGTCTTSGDVSETTCGGTERRYRITARSEQEGRAAVTLQSVFAVP
jgi:type IV pilus assembly protein PilX